MKSFLPPRAAPALGVAASLCLLAACVQTPVQYRDEVRLPPMFAHNLVLQKETVNPIWGRTTPGKPVWVTFHDLTATGKADRDGNWKVSLDLRGLGTPRPGPLVIGVGKKEQNPLCVLNDVAVGSVWLLGVCNGKGVPLQQRDYLSWDPEKIRFLTVTNLAAVAGAPPGDAAAWRRCSPGSLAPHTAGSLTAYHAVGSVSFYFATALSTTDGYVGIVQTTPGQLAAALGADVSARKDRGLARNPVRDSLNTALDLARADARLVDAARTRRIVDAQSRGEDISIPEVVPDDPLRAYPRGTLDPEKIPVPLLGFEGCIW